MIAVSRPSSSLAHIVVRLVAPLAVALLLAGCQLTSLFDLAPSDASGASASATSRLAAIRREHDLKPLRPDSTLEKAAERQAGYMAAAGLMEHTTGRGRDFASRMHRIDMQTAAAENIAYGRWGLDGLFETWMNSPGHRRNMLDPRFSKFGLASAKGSDGRRYWSLVLSE